MSTHAHCQYIGAGYLSMFRTLDNTAEVFELFSLDTVCGHINYVYFNILITWISVRGVPMKRNHRRSYAETFWVVALEVVV